MTTTHILCLLFATATIASAMDQELGPIEFCEVDSPQDFAVEYHSPSVAAGFVTDSLTYYIYSKPGKELSFSNQEELEEQFNKLKNAYETQQKLLHELVKMKRQ